MRRALASQNIVREHANWLSSRQHARRGAVASIVGMSVAILLIYAAVNAATKDTFVDIFELPQRRRWRWA